MADDVSPRQARARRFDVVRRGYDRAQVDAYLDELGDEVAALESAVSEATADALALGIDDKAALAKELGRIGGEISTILEAARSAAEGIRTRASTDAEKWRSEAEAETSAALLASKEQNQALRSGAWNEGTALLTSAVDEANKIRAEAQEDALFMRAEAERDAMRLTSDARRDREEALRSARQEAEFIVGEARAESDGLLASAQKQADLAQERARALEDRRSELLAELEATRASISLLEEEIDSRRQELETPEPEPEVHDEHDHPGLEGGGSVKIVAPSKVVTLRPVDSDELVAEVTALRASSAERAEAERRALETVAVIAPPEPALAAVPPEDIDPPAQATEVADTATSAPAATQAPSTPETSDEDPAHAERNEDPQPDEIGSLFAALRSADSVASVASAQPAGRVASATAVATREPEPDPQDTGPGPLEDAVPPAPAPEVVVGDESPGQALGAQNEALKEIKRALVDLQNETLEALRTDEAWVPPDDFMNRFDGPFATLPTSTGGDGSADAAAFASDLHDSVLSAIEDTRGSGKGTRAVAAAASKVFRTWRSDEAERRLRRL